MPGDVNSEYYYKSQVNHNFFYHESKHLILMIALCGNGCSYMSFKRGSSKYIRKLLLNKYNFFRSSSDLHDTLITSILLSILSLN